MQCGLPVPLLRTSLVSAVFTQKDVASHLTGPCWVFGPICPESYRGCRSYSLAASSQALTSYLLISCCVQYHDRGDQGLPGPSWALERNGNVGEQDPGWEMFEMEPACREGGVKVQ